jgi:hypothetical protein
VDRAEVARALKRIRDAADQAIEGLWERPQGFGADYSYFDLAEIGAMARAVCEALNTFGAEPGDARGIATVTEEAELVACADAWRLA